MRCHFHLVNCQVAIFDDTGVEVTDIEAAKAQALKAIQEMRLEDSQVDEDWQGWKLDIADPSGDILLSIPLNPQLH
jgi:hypothetical protein